MSLINIILAMMGTTEEVVPPEPVENSFLLKEDGSYLLLESGDRIILE